MPIIRRVVSFKYLPAIFQQPLTAKLPYTKTEKTAKEN